MKAEEVLKEFFDKHDVKEKGKLSQIEIVIISELIFQIKAN